MAVYKVLVCQKPQNVNCFSLKEQQILFNRDFIILLSLKVVLWKKDFLSDVVYLLLGRVFEPKKDDCFCLFFILFHLFCDFFFTVAKSLLAHLVIFAFSLVAVTERMWFDL